MKQKNGKKRVTDRCRCSGCGYGFPSEQIKPMLPNPTHGPPLRLCEACRGIVVNTAEADG